MAGRSGESHGAGDVGSLTDVGADRPTAVVVDDRTDADQDADCVWIEAALVRYRARLAWLRDHEGS